MYSLHLDFSGVTYKPNKKTTIIFSSPEQRLLAFAH